jgi:imidazolonepropionase-like amidohydrolase
MDGKGTRKGAELLSHAGFSPVEVLCGAPIHPATWLGVDDRFGSIEPGNMANNMILDRNLLDCIDNIRSTWTVVRGGKLITFNEQ